MMPYLVRLAIITTTQLGIALVISISMLFLENGKAQKREKKSGKILYWEIHKLHFGYSSGDAWYLI